MKNLLLAFLIAGVTSSCSHPSSSAGKLSEADTLQARMAHAAPGWHNLDLEKDGVFGISTEKAYSQLLKNKKAKITIVAIIDSGIDTAQEDLKPVLWTDPSSGVHGWNWLGPENGKEDFTQILENENRIY